MFKVQHWPFAGIAITIGILVTCLLFLPMVLRNLLKDPKNPVPKIVYIIAFAGFMGDLVGFLFKIMHWPGAEVILITTCILLAVVAFPLYAYHAYKDHQHIANSFVFILIVMVWFIIPLTLTSLNFSRGVLNTVHEQNQSLNNDLEFLEEMNLITVAGLKDNITAGIIDDQTKNLMVFIEEMKVKTRRNEIPDSIEIIKLTNRVSEYENRLVSLVDDEECRATITRTLDEHLVLKNMQFSDPGFVLNHLIFLQMNIGIAEQTALKQLQTKSNQVIQVINQ